MTVSEALSTFDWSAFHPCGHPVQRLPDAPWTPCAQCYRHANTWVREKEEPTSPWAWKDERRDRALPLAQRIVFKRACFHVHGVVFEGEGRKRRPVNERGSGFLWVKMGETLTDSTETFP